MSTHAETAEHLRKAGEHIRDAARTWSEQLVQPEVRSHLRDAARSVLQAGIAAVDAADRRDRERQAARTAAQAAASTPQTP